MTISNFLAAFLTLFLAIGIFHIFKTITREISFETPVVHKEEEEDYEDDEVQSLPIAVATEPEKPRYKELFRFFDKLFTLEKTKKGSVRIAYFGDSMIENDNIVQAVRKNYQEKFGGQGVGFVTLSGPSYEWNLYSILNEAPASTIGITGYVSFANDSVSSWTYHKNGAHPTLFYGRSDNNDAKVIINTDTVVLKPTELLNKSSLTSALKVQFSNAGSIPFYGVDFSGPSGINIDGFPLRSSSGLPLGKLNTSLMNAFHRELNYDLLILHFGANVLDTKSKPIKYDRYAKNMTVVVNHLKKCFPGADILIISEADKATKYETEIKTDTTITALIQAQEKYALNTESAFINLFQLMGGEGSMVKWVNEDPPMANPDYTHFNHKGGTKIGNLIFEKLDEEYENFKINEKGEW